MASSSSTNASSSTPSTDEKPTYCCCNHKPCTGEAGDPPSAKIVTFGSINFMDFEQFSAQTVIPSGAIFRVRNYEDDKRDGDDPRNVFIIGTGTNCDREHSVVSDDAFICALIEDLRQELLALIGVGSGTPFDPTALQQAIDMVTALNADDDGLLAGLRTDLDAKCVEVDDHETRIAALENAGTPTPTIPGLTDVGSTVTASRVPSSVVGGGTPTNPGDVVLGENLRFSGGFEDGGGPALPTGSQWRAQGWAPGGDFGKFYAVAWIRVS